MGTVRDAAATEPSEAIQEYLQTIYTLADGGGPVVGARLAEFLGVSPAAVSEMLHRLDREGLVTLDARRSARLSATGRAIAERIARRHRLAERMLTDLLGYPWWKTHEEAERIEHAMSDEMEAHIARALGDPTTCPHGNPMPGVTPVPVRRIEELATTDEATVERIPDQFEHEPGFLEYLDSVGLAPGASVRVMRMGDDELRLRVDGVEHEVRRDVGRKVMVRA